MARSRNIKPGFFKNETLADLGFAAQILFAGLWTLADREGRLEDRPRFIKAEIFPYQKVHVDDLLKKLDSTGFIRRYTANDRNCIAIVNWHKHQNPHIKEAESCLPAPDEHHASTVQEQCLTGTSMEEESLIPDSLNLIPDSLIQDCAFAETQKTPSDLQDEIDHIPDTTKKVKRNAPKPKKPSDPRVNEVFKAIEEAYGEIIPHPAKQCAEIAVLLKNRDPADIVNCWKWKSQQKNGGWIELVFVTTDIADWKAGRLPGQKGQANGLRSDTREARNPPPSDGNGSKAQRTAPASNVTRQVETDWSDERALADRFK